MLNLFVCETICEVDRTGIHLCRSCELYFGMTSTKIVTRNRAKDYP